MTHSTLIQCQIHARFIKNAVAKIQSGIQTVAVQVDSGFQVCVTSLLRNMVADYEFHFRN
jgi:hypothetical protein